MISKRFMAGGFFLKLTQCEKTGPIDKFLFRYRNWENLKSTFETFFMTFIICVTLSELWKKRQSAH